MTIVQTRGEGGRAMGVFGPKHYKAHEVFGISTDILEPSYVDRGALDHEINKHLRRDRHITLKGESKCGKSWLRKKNIPDAIVVQCRLKTTVVDIYTSALSHLGIKLNIEDSKSSSLKGSVEATQEIGINLLLKFGAKEQGATEVQSGAKTKAIGKNINDLEFIADIIKASGKRLVIEDFHYLSSEERNKFAFDLKALWDYKLFVIIIGIWPGNNLLLHLNSDLSMRIQELSIYWSEQDLQRVINKGSEALNIEFSDTIKKKCISDSFLTVGILQQLVAGMLDEAGIEETCKPKMVLDEVLIYEASALHCADQLNAIYQTFAKNISSGIRTRTRSTGIYAHTLAVVLTSDDEKLSRGLARDDIYKIAHSRQPRIQKGNLWSVLEKLNKMQTDATSSGLIISYDPTQDEILVVDKQLLLYRKYATVRWPWEEIIEAVDASTTGYDADDG